MFLSFRGIFGNFEKQLELAGLIPELNICHPSLNIRRSPTARGCCPNLPTLVKWQVKMIIMIDDRVNTGVTETVVWQIAGDSLNIECPVSPSLDGAIKHSISHHSEHMTVRFSYQVTLI